MSSEIPRWKYLCSDLKKLQLLDNKVEVEVNNALICTIYSMQKRLARAENFSLPTYTSFANLSKFIIISEERNRNDREGRGAI
jgi:hypothetical protein